MQYYGEHLDRAGAPVEAYYALLCPEWAEAWFALRGTHDGFLVDVARVWEKAREDTSAGDSVRGMSKTILCALCHSSLVARRSTIDPQLLAMVVEAEIYTPTQAFDIIRHFHYEGQQLMALIGMVLLGLESDVLRQELLEASHVLPSSSRISILRALAEQSEGEVRHGLLQEALALARATERDNNLRFLLPLLPVPQALEVVWEIKHLYLRASALCVIAEQVEGEMRAVLLQESLALARTLPPGTSRAAALRFIAERSEGLAREALLQESLREICALPDGLRESELRLIAPLLPIPEAMAVTRELGFNARRVSVLCTLIEQADGETRNMLVQEALAVVGKMHNDSERAPAEHDLVRFLRIPEALRLARAIHTDSWRASALRSVAERAEGDTRTVLLHEALELARGVRDNFDSASVLNDIVPLLPLPEAFEAVHLIRDDRWRASTLRSLARTAASHLPSAFAFSRALDAWHESIQRSATLPRSALLGNLAALAPFTAALADADTVRSGESAPTLSGEAYVQLSGMMNQHLDLATLRSRHKFLSEAGLLALGPHLPMKAVPHEFVSALLQAVQSAPPEYSGSATEQLLRHLAVVWAGQPGRRAFVEGLLGIATAYEKPSRRLVGEIAQAVQEVSTWWT